MLLEFDDDVSKAIKAAGCKSKFFEEIDWHGVKVESSKLNDADFKIIKKVLATDEFKNSVDNRQLLRLIEQYQSMVNAGPLKAKVKNLVMLRQALAEVIDKLPHRWVFLPNEEYGWLLPYFVSEIKFTEASPRNGIKSHVTIELKAIQRGSEVEQNILIYRSTVVGGTTIEETLRANNVFLENPKMIEEYNNDFELYRKYSKQTGEQFLGSGIAKACDKKDEEFGWWRKNSKTFLDVEGAPAKVIIDDMIDMGSDVSVVSASKDDLISDEDSDMKSGLADIDEANDSLMHLPVHPILRVFHLVNHDFVTCYVNNLTPYQYNTGLINQLILPNDHIELLNALTTSAAERLGDIIVGKAVGVIIMCSGQPGTGKTLTAEVYSEVVKRPLYIVQCSQLGTDEETLEKSLSEVLARATRWKAILLIDEADVYVHERGDDIQQNAIVGVFLRLLEYYRGILFCTTNRATIIDDAIISRVTAHIHYEKPIAGDRNKIWKIMLNKYQVKHDDKLIVEAIDMCPNFSGRSIRQIIRLSKFISDFRKEPMSIDILEHAMKYHDFESEAADARIRRRND